MSEVDQSYQLKVLTMVINQYLDQTISATEESLKNFENKRDRVVWELATKIYTQSGHKVELCTVRDVVNFRIEAMKYQLAAEKKPMVQQAQARRIAEEKARQEATEQARCIAEEKARQEAAEQAHLRDEIKKN